MIQVSTEVANALSQTSRQFDAKIYVNGSAVDCEIMSLKLHKGACGKFTVGSIFIPYVELTVNGTTTLTTNTEFELKIAVKVNGSFGTYYRVGYFTPTSIENGRTQTEIYAQGRLADTNGVLFDTEPTARSLNNILTAIRNKGFTVDLKGLTIPSASIDQLIPLIGLSVRDGLSLLASCSGGYVTEDSGGHFVLGKFTQSTPIVVNGDALSEYPKVQGEYELTGITVVVSESLKFDIGGAANFQIENPYFNSDMVSQFTANTIGYTFDVTEMPVALGDFRFEPWDSVAILGGGLYPSDTLYPSDNLYPLDDYVMFTTPCLTLDFDFDGGLKTSIKAEGDLPEVTNTKTAGPISAQLKEAYDKAVGANDLANSVATDLATNYSTTEEVEEMIEEGGGNTIYTRVQYAYGSNTQATGTWGYDIPNLTSTYPYLWIRYVTVERDRTTGVETQVGQPTTPTKSTLLAGAYTFVADNYASNNDLSTAGATVINGANITTGSINASLINLSNAIYTGSHSYIGSNALGAYLGSDGIEYLGYCNIPPFEGYYKIAIRKPTGTTYINASPILEIRHSTDLSSWQDELVVYGMGGTYVQSLTAEKNVSGHNGFFDSISCDSLDSGTITSSRVDATNVYTSSQFRWLTSKPATGSAASGDQLYCVQSGGSGTGAYYVGFRSSSKYLKHDIKDVEDFDCTGLYDLPVRQYVWNEDETETPEIGFIADEVAEYFPVAAVYRDSYRDGKDPASWSDIAILPAMLKLIQDQHKEIELLKERLDNGL